jgi:hypothetical protein
MRDHGSSCHSLPAIDSDSGCETGTLPFFAPSLPERPCLGFMASDDFNMTDL